MGADGKKVPAKGGYRPGAGRPALPEDERKERVVLYVRIRTLPIHESQRELVELKDDEASYFELTVRPTFDLYQSLLAQADQIEVLEPASVRNEMRNFAKNLMSYYKD